MSEIQKQYRGFTKLHILVMVVDMIAFHSSKIAYFRIHEVKPEQKNQVRAA